MYSVADLHQYYQSDEGVKTAQHLAKDIAALWSPAADEMAAAVGFPFPFLANRHLPPVLMPNMPGAACWQGPDGVISAQIDSACWPISSDQLDRLFIAHALEFVPDHRQFLQEAARCLCGSGRLLLMVPHRRGMWARSTRTPFGHGTSFSRGQLNRLLLDCGLEPTAYHRSLISLPTRLDWPAQIKASMGRLGGRVARVFGGVLLVEAQKMVYVKKPASAKQQVRSIIKLQGKPALSQRQSRAAAASYLSDRPAFDEG